MHKHSHQLKHAMGIGSSDITAVRRRPGPSGELLVRLEQRRERERDRQRWRGWPVSADQFRKAIAQHFWAYTPNFAACWDYLVQHFTWHLQLVMTYWIVKENVSVSGKQQNYVVYNVYRPIGKSTLNSQKNVLGKLWEKLCSAYSRGRLWNLILSVIAIFYLFTMFLIYFDLCRPQLKLNFL